MIASHSRLPHLHIEGIAVCVPGNVVENHAATASDADMARLVEITGIARRRVVDEHTTSADLCAAAALSLLGAPDDEASVREDIRVLVYVTQLPDYLVPSTAHILQDRLNLPQGCVAIQVTEGCSGYVYGLFLLSCLLRAYPGSKGLLLAGDAISQVCNPADKSTSPLFGDAGSATLVSHGAGEDSFLLGGDGKGHKDIMIPNLGYRQRVTLDSFTAKAYNGLTRSGLDLHLDGMNVFTFGISKIPKLIKQHLEEDGLAPADIDFFVLHQANRMMLEKIRRKVQAAPEQMPYSLDAFGNTSSASIPVTLVSRLADRLSAKRNRLLLCGFGVGLSWGSLITELAEGTPCKLLDYEH